MEVLATSIDQTSPPPLLVLPIIHQTVVYDQPSQRSRSKELTETSSDQDYPLDHGERNAECNVSIDLVL